MPRLGFVKGCALMTVPSIHKLVFLDPIRKQKSSSMSSNIVRGTCKLHAPYQYCRSESQILSKWLGLNVPSIFVLHLLKIVFPSISVMGFRMLRLTTQSRFAAIPSSSILVMSLELHVDVVSEFSSSSLLLKTFDNESNEFIFL